jgi:hypothetical protein
MPVLSVFLFGIIAVTVASANAAEQQPITPLESISGALADDVVVARVDGTDIRVMDALGHYKLQLAQAKQQLDASEFRNIQDQLLRRTLAEHVDRMLTAQALKRQLTDQQRDALAKHIDDLFDSEVSQMIKKFNVDSRNDLEEIAALKGTTLQQLRQKFGQQLMMREYLRSVADSNDADSDKRVLAKLREQAEVRFAIDHDDLE